MENRSEDVQLEKIFNNLTPELQKDAMEKCPHLSKIGKEELKDTDPKVLESLNEEQRAEAIEKCPHFAHLKK